MVDAQPRDEAFAKQLKQQLMRRFEHFLTLHPQRNQFRDIEEAAVIDLVRADPPVSQPIMLLLQQRVQVLQRRLGSRRDWKFVVVIRDHEFPAFFLNAQFALLQHLPIVVFEHWQQHLPAQSRSGRVPIDVEKLPVL